MRKKFNLFRLKFLSPVHVGTGINSEEQDDFIHSDTLYSALYHLSLLVGSDLKDDILSGKILLSSLFPYYINDGRVVYFFPKPILNYGDLIKNLDYTLRKDFKKAKFIPLEIFEKIINEGVDVEDLRNYLELAKKTRYAMAKSVIPRVFIDRFSSNSDFFTFGVSYFSEGGLYCLCSCDDALYEKLEGHLKLLGEEGLGGDRTAGYGFFEVTTDTLEIEIPDTSAFSLLLSLVFPSPDDFNFLDLSNSYYELVFRTGWFLTNDGATGRRGGIWMFKEGSVLSSSNTIKGSSPNVAPEFLKNKGVEIYRFGFAFSIPVRLGL